MKKLFTCFVFLIFSLLVHAQLFEVNTDTKVAGSGLIVEGTVVAQTGFWNSNHSMIFTNNKIKVHKVFKGTVQADFIELMTMGGTVGNEHWQVTELLQLNMGDEGVFFCNPNTIQLKSPVTNALLYDVYSSAQGFLKYDKYQNTANAPFSRTEGISTQLYRLLQQKTGRNFTLIDASYQVDDVPHTEATPIITNLSPTTIHAGAFYNSANNLLTITGSNFGTAGTNAAVLFDDANDGSGGTAIAVASTDNTVVSWSDNMIQIKVPSRAGSGTIQVRNSGSETSAASAQSLNIEFSILNATFQIPSGTGPLYTKEANLMNTNGSGGYTIFYSTNTAGSGIDFTTSEAMAPFQRALNTWKQLCGFNVTEGGNTTNQSLASTTCTIMYDNANNGAAPMANGVLAYCTSNFSICTDNPSLNSARRLRFHVVLRNAGYSSGSATFTAGPCPPNSTNYQALDLETVLLHELGHAANLGHINDSYQGNTVGRINPAKLMNYAIINSVKRVSPDYSAMTGLSYGLTPKGNTYGSCTSTTDMTALSKTNSALDECPLSFPTTAATDCQAINFNLTYATSNKTTDPAYTQIRCDGFGTDVTANEYFAFKAPNSNPLTINIANYATNPAALAGCTSAYGGVEVTGVRLALYAVSACPTAGAFPAPIWCGTITGNGSLSPISGLSANATYLLLANAIDNTKASFEATIYCGAVPVKLSSFTGKLLPDANLLQWQIASITNVQKMELLKSADGNSFSRIQSFSDAALERTQNSYTDAAPFAGANYYRLKIYNNDGSIEYSDIVLLQRKEKLLVSVWPIPAKEQFTVALSAAQAGNYQLILTNPTGQAVRKKLIQMPAGNQQINIATSGLPRAVYYLQIRNKAGEKIKSQSIILE